MEKRFICCICGEECDGFGNNPWPVVKDYDAQCCDDCNWNTVIPARLQESNDGTEQSE